MRTLSLVIVPLLTACGTVTSNPVCPTLYSYSLQQREQAALTLEALDDGHALTTMMTDYGAVRAEIRACLSQR